MSRGQYRFDKMVSVLTDRSNCVVKEHQKNQNNLMQKICCRQICVHFLVVSTFLWIASSGGTRQDFYLIETRFETILLIVFETQDEMYVLRGTRCLILSPRMSRVHVVMLVHFYAEI